MDKVEYRELIRELKIKYQKKDYDGVIRIVEDVEEPLEPNKIRENSILEMIAMSYRALGYTQEARDTLLIAYKRAQNGKRIAYQLAMLCIELGDLESAVQFYEDFCKMAPKDSKRLLLKYEIGKAANISKPKLIRVLENYNAREMDEQWLYELARLYHEVGDEEKCIAACDDICIYYANGSYEKAALELKNAHASLSPSQQARYEELMQDIVNLGKSRQELEEEDEDIEDALEIQTISPELEKKEEPSAEVQEEEPVEEVPETKTEPEEELPAAEAEEAPEEKAEAVVEETPAEEEPVEEAPAAEAEVEMEPPVQEEKKPEPELSMIFGEVRTPRKPAAARKAAVIQEAEEVKKPEVVTAEPSPYSISDDPDEIEGQMTLTSMLDMFQKKEEAPIKKIEKEHESVEEVIEPEVPLLNREDVIEPVDDGGEDIGVRAPEFAFEKEEEEPEPEEEHSKELSVDATQFIPVEKIAAQIAREKTALEAEDDAVAPAVVKETRVYNEIDPGSAAGKVSVGASADPAFVDGEYSIDGLQRAEDFEPGRELTDAEKAIIAYETKRRLEAEEEIQDDVDMDALIDEEQEEESKFTAVDDEDDWEDEAPARKGKLKEQAAGTFAAFGKGVSGLFKKGKEKLESLRKERQELDEEDFEDEYEYDEDYYEETAATESSEEDYIDEELVSPEELKRKDTDIHVFVEAEAAEKEAVQEELLKEEMPASEEDMSASETETEPANETESASETESLQDAVAEKLARAAVEISDAEEVEEIQEEEEAASVKKNAFADLTSSISSRFKKRSRRTPQEMPEATGAEAAEDASVVEPMDLAEPEESEEELKARLQAEQEAAEKYAEEERLRAEQEAERKAEIQRIAKEQVEHERQIKAEQERMKAEFKKQKQEAKAREKELRAEIRRQRALAREEAYREKVESRKQQLQDRKEGIAVKKQKETEEFSMDDLLSSVLPAEEIGTDEMLKQSVVTKTAAVKTPDFDMDALLMDSVKQTTKEVSEEKKNRNIEDTFVEMVDELPRRGQKKVVEEIREAAVEAEELQPEESTAVEPEAVVEIAVEAQELQSEEIVEASVVETAEAAENFPEENEAETASETLEDEEEAAAEPVVESLEAFEAEQPKTEINMDDFLNSLKITEDEEETPEEEAVEAEEEAAPAEEEMPEETMEAEALEAEEEVEESQAEEAEVEEAAFDAAAAIIPDFVAAQEESVEETKALDLDDLLMANIKDTETPSAKAFTEEAVKAAAEEPSLADTLLDELIHDAPAKEPVKETITNEDSMEDFLSGLIKDKEEPKAADLPTEEYTADTTQEKPALNITKESLFGILQANALPQAGTLEPPVMPEPPAGPEISQQSLDDLLNETIRMDRKEIERALREADRKDATAPLDLNRPYVLSKEQRKILGEFLMIEGMEEDICSTIEKLVMHKRSGDETGGHLIVTGDAKTGKTYLTIELLKAVNQEVGAGNPRVAKVQAQALNGKSIKKVLAKVAGSDLIIENIGRLEDDTVRDLISAVRANTSSTMVILEGNELAADMLIQNFPDIGQIFKTRINIQELTLTQWAEVAQKYANHKGYSIEGVSLLALHAKIDEINTPNVRLGYAQIKRIVDRAIDYLDSKAGKRSASHARKAKDDFIPLPEESFL